jgi:hypothetical protein
MIETKGGIRYGVMNILGIPAEIPSQAPTSTNSGHLQGATRPVDFGSDFLEIYLWNEGLIKNSLVELRDKDKFNEAVGRLKPKVAHNNDKLCTLLPQSFKGENFTKWLNLLLLRLQVESGFKLVKVFMVDGMAVSDLNDYAKALPSGAILVPVLDEYASPSIFAGAYMWTLKKKLPIVGFFGRTPSKSNVNNMRNLGFILGRTNDKVVRFVSEITKKYSDGIVKSYLYNRLGFDVFSFATRRGDPNKEKRILEVVSGLKYEPLELHSKETCPLDGLPMERSVEIYGRKDRNSWPCSVYSIIEINRKFRSIAQVAAAEEFAKALEESFKLFADGLLGDKEKPLSEFLSTKK